MAFSNAARLLITHVEAYPIEHEIPAGYKVVAENNVSVKRGDVLADPDAALVKSGDQGELVSRVLMESVRIEDGKVIMTYEEKG